MKMSSFGLNVDCITPVCFSIENFERSNEEVGPLRSPDEEMLGSDRWSSFSTGKFIQQS